MVLGYLSRIISLLVRNYDGNLLNISRNYSVWIVILWEFSFGLRNLFIHAFFRNWEERKPKELMDKQKIKKWNPVNDKIFNMKEPEKVKNQG